MKAARIRLALWAFGAALASSAAVSVFLADLPGVAIDMPSRPLITLDLTLPPASGTH